MANLLKPIGFVLILGAVAAGAYYFGRATTDKKPVVQDLAQPAAPAVGGGAAALAVPGQGPLATALAPQVAPQVAPQNAGSANPAGVTPTPANPQVPLPAPRPTPTKAPATPVVAPSPVARTPVADSVPTVVVALSGDLVRTRAKAKVRLLGVKTPLNGPEVAKAQQALTQLLGDGVVRIQLTADRRQALVWKDGVLVNEAMVRQGWSRAADARFVVAEAAAKTQGAGLWSPDGWMGVNP